jgi:hypothetical protein
LSVVAQFGIIARQQEANMTMLEKKNREEETEKGGF